MSFNESRHWKTQHVYSLLNINYVNLTCKLLDSGQDIMRFIDVGKSRNCSAFALDVRHTSGTCQCGTVRLAWQMRFGTQLREKWFGTWRQIR